MIKTLLIVLSVVLVGLQYRLWIAEGSFTNIAELKEQLHQQQAVNQQLLERNQRLEAQVIEYKEGLDSVEENARNQLGMIRKGESFYQLLGE